MAVNINAPTQEQVYEVMSMTTCYDENLIYSALQARNNDLAAVVNEFFDDPEKVRTATSRRCASDPRPWNGGSFPFASLDQ